MTVRKWGTMVATAAMVMIGCATATPAAQAQSVAFDPPPFEVGRPVPAQAAYPDAVSVACAGGGAPGAFNPANYSAGTPCGFVADLPDLELTNPAHVVTCHVTLTGRTWGGGQAQVTGGTVAPSVSAPDPTCNAVVLNELPTSATPGYWAGQFCSGSGGVGLTTRLSFSLGGTTVAGTLTGQYAGGVVTVNGPVVGSPPFHLQDPSGATLSTPPTVTAVPGTPCP